MRPPSTRIRFGVIVGEPPKVGGIVLVVDYGELRVPELIEAHRAIDDQCPTSCARRTVRRRFYTSYGFRGDDEFLHDASGQMTLRQTFTPS